MKLRGSDANALVVSYCQTLQTLLGEQPALHSLSSELQRLGLSLTVRVELSPGGEAPRVAVGGRRGESPAWSERDVELLHSLGIASEAADDPEPPDQPRRRQPR